LRVNDARLRERTAGVGFPPGARSVEVHGDVPTPPTRRRSPPTIKNYSRRASPPPPGPTHAATVGNPNAKTKQNTVCALRPTAPRPRRTPEATDGVGLRSRGPHRLPARGTGERGQNAFQHAPTQRSLLPARDPRRTRPAHIATIPRAHSVTRVSQRLFCAPPVRANQELGPQATRDHGNDIHRQPWARPGGTRDRISPWGVISQSRSPRSEFCCTRLGICRAQALFDRVLSRAGGKTPPGGRTRNHEQLGTKLARQSPSSRCSVEGAGQGASSRGESPSKARRAGQDTLRRRKTGPRPQSGAT